MINVKQMPFLALLIAAVFFSSWLLMSKDKKVQPQADARFPDLIMEDVIGTRMDANGKLKARLYSPKLMRYSSKDLIDFIQPHLIFYNDEEAPWHVYAMHGQTQEGFNTVLFWDNVKLQQSPPNKPEVTITTTTLTVYPKKDLALTDQPATLITGLNSVNTVGVRANLKTEEVELLSKARGHYVPKS